MDADVPSSSHPRRSPSKTEGPKGMVKLSGNVSYFLQNSSLRKVEREKVLAVSRDQPPTLEFGVALILPNPLPRVQTSSVNVSYFGEDSGSPKTAKKCCMLGKRKGAGFRFLQPIRSLLSVSRSLLTPSCLVVSALRSTYSNPYRIFQIFHLSHLSDEALSRSPSSALLAPHRLSPSGHRYLRSDGISSASWRARRRRIRSCS